MEIQRAQAISFKNNYTSDDLYRLEQKLDSLQAELNRNDLSTFYRELPKQRSLPMPTGVPPYAMNGMMGVGMGTNGMMPPIGGMYGSMGAPMGMPMGLPGAPMMPPAGGMCAGPMSPPMGMPPAGAPNSRLSGQPLQDTYCRRP